MSALPIVITIQTRGSTPTVKSNSTSIDSKTLKKHRAGFIKHFAPYCAEYCELSLEGARKNINTVLDSKAMEVVPWWTTMTIRMVDRWKIKSSSKVKVCLAQRRGVYLCHVYEVRGNKKTLLTSPVLGSVRDRILEVGTVHNYFRYYTDNVSSFSSDFMRRHTFEFDLVVHTKRSLTTVTLTPTPLIDSAKSEGIYNFKNWLLPLPNRRDETKESSVLVSSGHVQSLLPSVGAAWAHMKACNILFLAPSGSGKDVVTNFFCDGMAPELTGEIVSLSLAGLTSEESRAALFGGAIGTLKGVIGALPKAQKVVNKRLTKPKSGIVFVDEIHHPASADARASLLRVMESRQYEHPKHGVTDCDNLYFVFAASCTVDELRAIEPPDFWNRMDFIIEMQHPLDDEKKKRDKVIKDYFDLFFSREIDSLVARQLGDGKLGNYFLSYFSKEFKKHVTSLSAATEEFARYAGYLRPGLLSVRHLRALAQVLAADLIEFVFERATSKTQTVEAAITEWIKEGSWRNVIFGRLGEIIASR